MKTVIIVRVWSFWAAFQIHAAGLDGSATAAPREEIRSAPFTSAALPKSKPITAPLRTSPNHPNYFRDGSDKAVYLTGSHTWNNFQDWGTDDAPQPFDFAAYVKMLVHHNHNFT